MNTTMVRDSKQLDERLVELLTINFQRTLPRFLDCTAYHTFRTSQAYRPRTAIDLINMFVAPADIRFKAPPTKTFDERLVTSKFSPDKESGPARPVYVEDGKRKIPRTGQELKKRMSSEKSLDYNIMEKRMSGPFTVDIDDSTLFDEDLFSKAHPKECPGPYDPERVRLLYMAACELLRTVPSQRYLRVLHSGRINLSNQGLGPIGCRAVVISLISYLRVTEVNMDGNNLGPQGMECLVQLIHDNETVKTLGLNNNGLGRQGAKVLANAMADNESIEQFNAVGNNFDDIAAVYLAHALQENRMIKQLDLSRNEIGEEGAKVLAEAMMENTTITHLDLSHNFIRFKAWKAVSKMLVENTTLLNLNLAWNGLGDRDGTKWLGMGLNENSSLSILNINGCRVNLENMAAMLARMPANNKLASLLIADNPITTADLEAIVSLIDNMPETSISFLDASSVTVTEHFMEEIKAIESRKPGFCVTTRGVFGQKDFSKNMLQTLDLTGGDPLEALIKYARSKNLRLVDIFARIDTDKSGSVTRQELIHGVAEMGIPLSIKQMDKLIEKVDSDGDGEVDFSELLSGYKKFMRKMHKQGIVARTALKGDDDPTAPQQPVKRLSIGGIEKGSSTRAMKKADPYDIDEDALIEESPTPSAHSQRTLNVTLPSRSSSSTLFKLPNIGSQLTSRSGSKIGPDMGSKPDVGSKPDMGSKPGSRASSKTETRSKTNVLKTEDKSPGRMRSLSTGGRDITAKEEIGADMGSKTGSRASSKTEARRKSSIMKSEDKPPGRMRSISTGGPEIPPKEEITSKRASAPQFPSEFPVESEAETTFPIPENPPKAQSAPHVESSSPTSEIPAAAKTSSKTGSFTGAVKKTSSGKGNEEGQ